ncbi:MAG: ribosome-associated translation inhibitor RaiA [Alphaproteobacteria bacterium]|jgi:ribosomal subunit interface protein|nr:ribosome-associated translation inhibitor RaiA [Alphaproteobacteria bacterium]
MQITLTGKQVDIGEKLRSHVEEGVLTSVNKYFPAPISCTVAFSKEGDNFNAEVTVHPARNIVLKGSGTASDPYSAFDDANVHIATRLRRHKTRLNDHKGKTGLAEAEIANESVYSLHINADEMEIDENAPLTIAETEANIPVCTVSEAVMHMDLVNECAIMFRNSANNHISMVYRRKDGNIGWVEPKAAN